MSTETATHPTAVIASGSIVRLTRAVTEAEVSDWGFDRAHEGRRGIVQTFFAEGSDDSEGGPACYWLDPEDSREGTDFVVPADSVELVMAAADVERRALPTASEVRSAVDWLSQSQDLEIHSADVEGENAVVLEGLTDDGLAFAATVTITNIRKADG